MRRYGAVALEIFSGSGHFAAEFRKQSAHIGFGIFEWDIRWGPRYDLVQPAVQKRFRGWVRAGWIKLLWLDTPCTTFSVMQFIQAAGPLRS